jgi:hypothetical protein
VSYLIYAAYGSNLLKERLLAYIKGGKFENRDYDSCKKDTSEPESLGWMFVPHRLYFAKKSRRWDSQGVAFLSCKKEETPDFYAVVRLWKVSEIQFECIKRQEGAWYNHELILGEKDGLIIKTMTGCWEKEVNPPSERYLQVIKRGLKETTEWSDKEIENYLRKFLPKA